MGFDVRRSARSPQLDDPRPTNVRDNTPDDPDYDRAEADDETAGVTPSTNVFDERFTCSASPDRRPHSYVQELRGRS